MEGLNFQAVTTDRFDNLLNKMNSVVTPDSPTNKVKPIEFK